MIVVGVVVFFGGGTVGCCRCWGGGVVGVT